jgi:hypothetical protein
MEMRMYTIFKLENLVRKCHLGDVEVYWEDIKMDPRETGIKV